MSAPATIPDLDPRPGNVAAAGDVLEVGGPSGSGRIPATPAGIGATPATFLHSEATSIFEGDSLFHGNTIVDDPEHNSIPYYYSQGIFGGGVAPYNFAVGGSLVATMDARYFANVYPLRPSVTGKRTYLFILIGTNDLDPAFGNATAATVLAAIAAYTARARSHGFIVILCTLLPRGGASWTTGAEARRIELNGMLLRRQASADMVVNLSRVVSDFANINLFHDRIHLTPLGNALAAQFLNLVMLMGGDPLGSGLGSDGFSWTGLLSTMPNAYAVFGRAYMQTLIGSANGADTGFLGFRNLAAVGADTGYWIWEGGLDGNAISFRSRNDANNGSLPILRFLRDGYACSGVEIYPPLSLKSVPSYPDDAAADADAGLLSGCLYRTTVGGRSIFRKP